MAYLVQLTPHADRAFRKLDSAKQARLGLAIDNLADLPRPPGAEKLSGLKDTYRVRVGDYRILYEINDKRLLVLVMDLGHRREVYRR